MIRPWIFLVPMEMLPDELYEAFNHGDSTLMAIILMIRLLRMRR